MYELSAATIDNITKSTGISYDEFSNLDCSEIDKRIEQKINKKLKYSKKKDMRILGRGNVFISLMKFIYISDTEKKLSKI